MSEELRPSQLRRRLLDAATWPCVGWLRTNEPIFRNWDRLSVEFREDMKQLKSEHIANVNWPLRW